MAITVKEAQTLYVSYFGRPADFVGLQYWTGTETLVGSLEQLAHSFYNSAEGKKYFPVDPATNQVDVTASINAIYANMFGRVPETAGFDYWYNEIASGKINPAEAAVAIYKGAQGKDALMIENKIAAATQFTDQVAASNQPSLYYGDQAFAKANEFLNTVTDVTDVTSAGFAAQVNAAVNVAEAAGGASSSEGGIFKLNIDGTPNSDGGTLTNEANVGFTPEGKYLTAGNDVIDLSEWTGSGNVTIGDAFSNDNDKVSVLAAPLSTGPGVLKLTAVENLEIINSVPRSNVKLTGANFKGLEAVKLIGDDTNLDVSDFTYGVKIDATENADHIRGSDKADTINGGAGNDTIVGNDGDDVLTGGNGADEFFVGTVKAAGVDQILDFSAEDKITMVTATTGNFSAQELKKFDASTFSTVTYKTLDSVLATFGAGGANVTKPGDVAIFSYDGKTYALLANGVGFLEANDALVDITGANVASLTESNFGGVTNTTPSAPIPAPTPIGTIYPDYATFVNDAAFGKIPAGEQVGIETLTGPEAGMLAVNKAYLDKIAAGGIGSVTGAIAVTVGDNGTVSDNFDSAVFATKLADSVVKSDIVMNINGSTAGDVIISTFGGEINGNGGADTITANATATINGSGGKDTIYLKAGGSVDGGADDDTIYVSGSGEATITGGDGNDTISLGDGADVVDFSTIKSAANANKVIGFDVAKDKLQFDATSFTYLTANTAVKIVTKTGAKNEKDQIVVDSKTNIDLLDTSSNSTGKVNIAIATDTGDIIYDENGNFTDGNSVVIGNIGSAAAANLTADNFVVVA